MQGSGWRVAPEAEEGGRGQCSGSRHTRKIRKHSQMLDKKREFGSEKEKTSLPTFPTPALTFPEGRCRAVLRENNPSFSALPPSAFCQAEPKRRKVSGQRLSTTDACLLGSPRLPASRLPPPLQQHNNGGRRAKARPKTENPAHSQSVHTTKVVPPPQLPGNDRDARPIGSH